MTDKLLRFLDLISFLFMKKVKNVLNQLNLQSPIKVVKCGKMRCILEKPMHFGKSILFFDKYSFHSFL